MTVGELLFTYEKGTGNLLAIDIVTSMVPILSPYRKRNQDTVLEGWSYGIRAATEAEVEAWIKRSAL